MRFSRVRRILLVTLAVAAGGAMARIALPAASSPIRFAHRFLPFRLESGETEVRHFPATMAGGIAVFDYNHDGRPDIFFTNGANLATLQKDAPKFRNKLFRNDGGGAFTDVTERSGLAGTGFDDGAAVADYDNDGNPDIFVAGVHRSTLYHNNGNGTFTDMTARSGLSSEDAQYGPMWAIAGAWVDVNQDGLLDLFVVNYVRWSYREEPLCAYRGFSDYCAPSFYRGAPNRLYLNKGDGTFQDVSQAWGIRSHVGKGMGVGVADYDLDGKPDLFVTNDGYYNFLFHNTGSKFEEVALQAGVAVMEDGNFISGMGLDFRDFDNDGYPDLAFVALNNQTFPLFRNVDGHEFRETTYDSGMREASVARAGFGAALYDFDNDGWKDFFVTGGHALVKPLGAESDQYNVVFRNPGSIGKWRALIEEAGLTAGPASRHRGCAFGDFDGDGRVDVVTTALGRDAELWMNRSDGSGHWLDLALEGTSSNRDGIGTRVKLTAKGGTRYNHRTSSVGYASSSDGPVHFGLGVDARADAIEIRWPSGILQVLRDVEGDRVVKVKEPAR